MLLTQIQEIQIPCIGVYINCGFEIIPNRNEDTTILLITAIVDETTILKGEETLEYLIKKYDSQYIQLKDLQEQTLMTVQLKKKFNLSISFLKLYEIKKENILLFLLTKSIKK